ncbi:hypothetical protein PAMC26510_31950 [Caballeronia sordidicola]|uniref:Uncharacterized protein n=1 Tax=Caballeronia sordidicola TaxID=196367 RepID=A0A242M7C9_CABSO|nr:hypothetical protein PAMC26510_31950 [Caballeronia sordidicola]
MRSRVGAAQKGKRWLAGRQMQDTCHFVRSVLSSMQTIAAIERLRYGV